MVHQFNELAKHYFKPVKYVLIGAATAAITYYAVHKIIDYYSHINFQSVMPVSQMQPPSSPNSLETKLL